jgi:hypothetical protein
MPRYANEDEYRESRGVHRRRLERKGSSTPIIVGGIIAVAVILVFVFLTMSGKEDPEERDRVIRQATERTLLACLSKERTAIFKSIEPTGASGWVIKRHNQQNRLRYRFWKKMETPEAVEKAKQFRLSEDDRMFKELVALPGKLGLMDSAMVKDVIARSKVRVAMSEATMILRNARGEVKILIGPGEKAKWIVQYWEVVRAAVGSR